MVADAIISLRQKLHQTSVSYEAWNMKKRNSLIRVFENADSY